LDELMDQLNERDREALLLRFFEGRPFAELGKKIGASEDAARKRVDRALEKLRGALARRGVKSTSAVMGMLLANQTVLAAPSGLAATVTGSALALGSGATPPVLTFFYLMNAKIIAAAAVVVLLGLVGTSRREFAALHAADVALAAATSDYASTAAKRRELSERLQETEKSASLLATNLAAEEARAASAAAALAVQAAKPIEDPIAAGYAFLARHPPVKQALAEYAAARSKFRFGPLYEALQFTPEQVREFESLWGIGMGAQGAGNASLQLMSAPDIPRAEATRRLREVVGKDDWNKFGDHANASAARDIAAKVGGALYFTETPLAPQQADEVMKIFARHRSRAGSPGDGTYDWKAVIGSASVHLTPPQLEVLNRMQAEDRFHAALNAPPPSESATGRHQSATSTK
jgi:hypothetical protein